VKKLKPGAIFADPLPRDLFAYECGVWIILEVKGNWLKSKYIGKLVNMWGGAKQEKLVPIFRAVVGGLTYNSYFRNLKQSQVTGKLLKEIEGELIQIHY